MRQHGRKTTNTLAVIDANRGSRPAPLASLPDAESGIWARVVGAMPPDWLGKESYELLAQYCRLALQAVRLRSELDLTALDTNCALLVAALGGPPSRPWPAISVDFTQFHAVRTAVC